MQAIHCGTSPNTKTGEYTVVFITTADRRKLPYKDCKRFSSEAFDKVLIGIYRQLMHRLALVCLGLGNIIGKFFSEHYDNIAPDYGLDPIRVSCDKREFIEEDKDFDDEDFEDADELDPDV